MAVIYEFVVETLDYYNGCGDDPDIIDTWAFDTLKEAQNWANFQSDPVRIALKRDVYDYYDGLIDRSHAYFDSEWKLPENFTYGMEEIGPSIPKRFHK